MKKGVGKLKKGASRVMSAILSAGILLSQASLNVSAVENELDDAVVGVSAEAAEATSEVSLEDEEADEDAASTEATPEASSEATSGDSFEEAAQESSTEAPTEESAEDGSSEAASEASSEEAALEDSAAEASSDEKDLLGAKRGEGTYDGVLSEKGGKISNEYFEVTVGEFGQITSLKLVGDEFDTNYVMNKSNAPSQNTSGHQWVGELMLATKSDGESSYRDERTSNSGDIRSIYVDDENDKITVVYDPTEDESVSSKEIDDVLIVETYQLVGEHFKWDISIENLTEESLTIGDLGLPLPFNEFWTGGDQIYETRAVDHSFVGQNGSYIYVTRPSGQGRFLLMTPDQSTDAGFEYQDHWRTSERESYERDWCQDESGWQNGLNVFYIHSDYIKKTGRGYLENTSLKLEAGEKHNYAFNFSSVSDETELGSKLYQEGLIDAVAVPGMAFAKNMPAKMYLHTQASVDDISINILCPDQLRLHDGKRNTVSSTMPHQGDATMTYEKTVELDGEQYHVYNLKFYDLGQHNVEVTWQGKKTTFQFYIMDNIDLALDTHSTFMVEKTQLDLQGQTGDKVFDDWMMDNKTTRSNVQADYFNMSYWGWGDDWGLTHGTFLAEKNVYQPKAVEVSALDEYLDIAIWNGLMQEHQSDYLIHDFLMNEPNSSPTYRGYAYPHIYNTYFMMYKIASKYPDLIDYKESADTYLLRAYNILNALYNGKGVSYNWGTGVMGESTTPAIIEALRSEGHENEARNVEDIMNRKYNSFKSQKYPYGSEYSYDNTGEEAVYVLAKMQFENGQDRDNAFRMLSAINEKTRACRGTQPVWYAYSVPVTNCGENWWQFQYSTSLIGFCMDDYLRYQNNGFSARQKAEAQRLNYAAKLGNLTCINSGQIDSDPENIGASAWTYQAEMGNLGGQGTGGGKLHNGWRQMTGESDLGLFGAVQILSSDVAEDPVFGLFGYGCEVSKNDGVYEITPLDGLYTKLNLINEEVYIELERDQYVRASLSESKDAITLTMKNLEQTPHISDITVYGLSEGDYVLYVEGNPKCGFTVASQNSDVVIPVSLSGAEFEEVSLAKGTFEGAVVVNAGEDMTVDLYDDCKLTGTITNTADASAKISGTWSLTSAEEGAEATIATPENLSTFVTFNKVGVYVFTLTASTGETDEVQVTVTDDNELPELVTHYSFDNINGKKLVNDVEGGPTSDLVGNIKLGQGKDGTEALVVGGSNSSGYVRLNPDITKKLDQITVAVDINLSSSQESGAAVFSFDDKNQKPIALQIMNGNRLYIRAGAALKDTGVSISKEYWKNVALSINGTNAVLYVDGVKKYEGDIGTNITKLGDGKVFYLGRNTDQSDAFFNGSIDNVTILSSAVDENRAKELFGVEEEITVKEILASDVVTPVGKEPTLPEKVQVLYSNGIYETEAVTWNAVPAESYAKPREFVVEGTVGEAGYKVTVKVLVVKGTLINLAENAVPTAIFEDRNDLGGCPTMNDGYDPSSSRDTSHGVWHNWNGKNSAQAWVQYTWNEPQIITSSDAYYFRDGNGNFDPASVNYYYLAEDGKTWMNFSNVSGLGVELNKYNTTTFDPVKTKAIRMTMNPRNLGCGVIEWKVFGYGEAVSETRQELKARVKAFKKVKNTYVEEGFAEFTEAIRVAEEALDNPELNDDDLFEIDWDLQDAFRNLVIKDDNWAFVAELSASYTSSWESLPAVNDGKLPKSSNSSTFGHWGTWGNTSTTEYLTYLWPTEIGVSYSDIYLWYDGSNISNGGIKYPAKIELQKLDASGNWVSIETIPADKLVQDDFTETDCGFTYTRGIRAVFTKDAYDYTGVGVHEWQAHGWRTERAGTLSTKNGRTTLSKNGKRVTGLRFVGGGWRFFKENGSMVINDFVDIGQFTYYFDGNGFMVRGRFMTKWTDTYYFDMSGHMIKDSIYRVKKYYYYFNSKGHMVTNKFVTIGDDTYYFNNKGHMVTGFMNKWGSTFYFEPDGKQVINQLKTLPDGYTYFFDQKGAISRAEMVDFADGTRYFDKEGHMVVNYTLEKWGKKYFFNQHGILVLEN